MKKAIITIVCMLIMVFFATAQAPIFSKVTIKGVVKEKNSNIPIMYANVVIFNASDSSFLTGVVTGEDGSFLLEKIPLGKYYYEVDYLGYKKQSSNINLTSDKKEITLNDIFLELDAVNLKEVNITGQNSALKVRADKKTIDVSKNITSKGGSAIDALKSAPSVTTTADGKILLRGSTNYKVLINGKPTALQPEDALKQTPSEIIDKIEIITNPSVKYNAAGTAGIINILLKKDQNRGFNAMINTSVGLNNKYSSSANINFNTKKLSLSSTFDWNNSQKDVFQEIYRSYRSGDTLHELESPMDRKRTESNFGINMGANYQLNNNNNIIYSLHVGNSSVSTYAINKNKAYSKPTINTEYYLGELTFGVSAQFYTNNLSFTHKFDDKGSILTANAYHSYIDYSTNNDQINGIANESWVMTDDRPFQQELENNNFSNNYRYNLDFVKIINKKIKFEIGAAANLFSRKMDVNFYNYDYDSQSWIVDEENTNKIDFNEDVYAGYSMINADISNIEITLGLRAEYTDRMLTQITKDTEYIHENLDLFPAFTALKKLKNNQEVSFNFSRRINRPEEHDLNPYTEYSDNYAISNGNPNLIPELTSSFEFTYRRFIKSTVFSMQAYYKSTPNKIGQMIMLDDKNRIHMTYSNHFNESSTGIETTTRIPIAKWWNLNGSINLFYSDMEGTNSEYRFSHENFSWDTKIMSSFTITKNTSAQLFGMYISDTQTDNGKLKAFYRFDVGINQSFFDKKLALSVNFKDILQSANYFINLDQPTYNFSANIYNESPVIMFSLTYKINKYKKNVKNINTEIDL